MAINPKCDKCGSELREFGGLVFSPPNEHGVVRKWHLCKECYKELERSFQEKN